jgi:transcriptional regulator with XRE-family HTH domain
MSQGKAKQAAQIRLNYTLNLRFLPVGNCQNRHMATLSFGDVLATQVARAGLTMAQFAAQVGVAGSTLSRLRAGTRRPNLALVEQWADALRLSRDERAALLDSAVLARAPRQLRERLTQAEDNANAEQARRVRVEEGFTALRQARAWYDGWWLSASMAFANDGRVQRSLLRIDGTSAQLTVMELGATRFSYTGRFEMLGDKAFIRLEEERGCVEYVQITLQTTFDAGEPVFLYGLVTGISGKDLRRPVSFPACSRIVLLYAGAAAGPRLAPYLGLFSPRAATPLWPDILGPDRRLRQTLEVAEDGDLDAALLDLLDNRLRPGDSVLRAAVSD